ncbi:Gfo/Idh/MocA family oxidoreductase [Candidatus Sumerlaeota bacterium]|nr:Gfo/Idh/MocA family oxidoreductase [Candidatus Sumerlaeota bacterium]
MKVAQVGYGYWGRNLMRVLSSIKGVQVVLCCEINPKARQELKDTYPWVKQCEDLEDIINRKDIDAVILATPAGLHYEQTKKMLTAHKHVFVEKPLALSVEQAKELVELAEQNKCTLMVGHTFLYNDAVRYVKDYIRRGELGEVYYAYFQRLNLGGVRQDVDALWNLAPHDISIAQYWFAEPPIRVESQGISFLQEGINDVAFLSLYYPSGRFVHIHVSWLSPFKIRQAVVIGSKKMIFYDDTSADRKVVIYDSGIDRKDVAREGGAVPFKDFGQFTFIKRTGDILIPKISFREPLQVEMQEFVDCVMQGKRPLSDGRNGLEVVEILESAQKSCHENR